MNSWRTSYCLLDELFLTTSRRILAIKHDVECYVSYWQGLWARDKIKGALAKHEKKLMDCFNSFMVNNLILLSLIILTLVYLDRFDFSTRSHGRYQGNRSESGWAVISHRAHHSL
jgi:hypothetical protein